MPSATGPDVVRTGPRHIHTSSSAKADDPVFQSASDWNRKAAGVLDTRWSLSSGAPKARPVGGYDDCAGGILPGLHFAPCAFARRIECWSAIQQESQGSANRCPPCHPLPAKAAPQAERPTMSSWSVQVLPECTCCTGCAGWDCRSGSTSRAVTSGEPGTGTAIPGHAAMSKACSIPIRSRKSCSRSGTGASAMRRSPKF